MYNFPQVGSTFLRNHALNNKHDWQIHAVFQSTFVFLNLHVFLTSHKCPNRETGTIFGNTCFEIGLSKRSKEPIATGLHKEVHSGFGMRQSAQGQRKTLFHCLQRALDSTFCVRVLNPMDLITNIRLFAHHSSSISCVLLHHDVVWGQRECHVGPLRLLATAPRAHFTLP